ncbi:MAG: aldolase [Eubacterium sp.]|nr:aldolase [Eubacterium sp.]
MLDYYYITNKPSVASVADGAGVACVFVDLEYMGKDERQPFDTVKNHHTVEDVIRVRRAVKNADLLVRVNPLFDGSAEEIERVIEAGADIVMLPMWNSADEVERFIGLLGGRARPLPLLETDSAAKCVGEILKLDGIEEIHIGLNDLKISQNKRFLFELFVDGTVDALAEKISGAGKRFGVGGVGAVGKKIALPAENILAEHYRLGSSSVILSRAFCPAEEFESDGEFKTAFLESINANREYEKMLSSQNEEYFSRKHKETTEIIREITG